MAFERSNREYFEGLIKGNISCLRWFSLIWLCRVCDR
jgi:hypothetical protein